MEDVPADTSALIYLAKADVFSVVDACGWRLLIPPAVWGEAVEAGEGKGASEVHRIVEAERRGAVTRVSLRPEQLRDSQRLRVERSLGTGESEALALGREHRRLVIDDVRAQRVASDLGVHAVSTVALPVLAWERGGLPRQAALQALTRLAVVANVSAELLVALQGRLGGDAR